MSARYALYYAPHKDEVLYHLMAPLLGLDSHDGCDSMLKEPAAPEGIGQELWRSLAGTPAHYGLHATLKAPFELRSESTESELKAACRKVAERHAAWVTAPLELQRLPVHSGERQKFFLALAPRRDNIVSKKLMADLERDAVMALERFRAPLDRKDMERREPLSADERRNLLQWGYHHVLELFHFHITLTGPLPCECADQVEAVLRQYLEPVINTSLNMDSICLFHQTDRKKPFYLAARFPLKLQGTV